MYLDELMRLIFNLLPIVLVLFLHNKKLLLATIILGFDAVKSSITELFGECIYCGGYDGTVASIFYFISLAIGMYAFIVLLKRKRVGFVQYAEKPSRELALKKTKRFYHLVIILLFLIIWLTFFFGNGIYEVYSYVIPFILKGLFFSSTAHGILLHLVIGFLYYFVCLLELKSRKSYIISSTIFYSGIVLFYVFSVFLMIGSATI